MSLSEFINNGLKHSVELNTQETNVQTIKDIHKSQHSIIIAIHNEFSKTFIKKLYQNQRWTERIYWAVLGKLLLDFEDIKCVELQDHIRKYLSDNKLPNPRQPRYINEKKTQKQYMD